MRRNGLWLWVLPLLAIGLSSLNAFALDKRVSTRSAGGTDTDYYIPLTLTTTAPPAANQYLNYPNGATGGIKTRLGNRTFNQNKYNLAFDGAGNINGVTSTGAAVVINKDDVRRYWNNYYGANYTGSGEENLNYNCWWYALPPNTTDVTWVEDPAYLYADDFQPTATLAAKNRVRQDGHVIVILTIQNNGSGGPNYVRTTSEKNRESRIYQRTYPLSDAKTFTDMHERKTAWDNF